MPTPCCKNPSANRKLARRNRTPLISIEQTITVEAPISLVHARWLEFERFPEFMEGVDEVIRLDETRMQWRGEFIGSSLEWESQIMVHMPNQRISWRTCAGFDSSGAVTFNQEDENATRVTLGYIFDPSGLTVDNATLLTSLHAQLGRDLQRFKEWIEGETGNANSSTPAPNLPTTP